MVETADTADTADTAKKLETADTLELARSFEEEIRKARRHIHQNPELSFDEHKTAKYVAEALKDMGLEPQIVADGIGVIAEIFGTENGKESSKDTERFIAIRADMDALPILEDSSQDYCSENKGVMHACGHDVHTACGLGAAMILKKIAEAGKLKGNVRFLFQPAEESTNSQGKSGAGLMIDQGALHNVDGVIGLHVFPEIPVGVVGLRKGALLAACDKFDITIKGRGCHGAYPQDGVDALVLASQVVQVIQTIASRRKSALSPCVLTLGGIRSSTYKSNIVAEAVEMTGTVRYFEAEMSQLIQEELRRALSIVEPFGGSFELQYISENPPLINDGALVDIVKAAADQLLGAGKVIEPGLQMGAEDFSFYCNQVPSCFAILGAEIAGDRRALHTPRFDVDERSLPLGAALLAQSALNFLNK